MRLGSNIPQREGLGEVWGGGGWQREMGVRWEKVTYTIIRFDL